MPPPTQMARLMAPAMPSKADRRRAHLPGQRRIAAVAPRSNCLSTGWPIEAEFLRVGFVGRPD